jgi:hypothetical protein
MRGLAIGMLAREETHGRVLFLRPESCSMLILVFSVSRRSLIKLLSSRSLACFFLFTLWKSLLSLA